MAARTITFAAARQQPSPLHQQRRDLVLPGGDTARVLLTLYEQDGDAAPLNVADATGQATLWREGGALALAAWPVSVVNAAAGLLAFDLDGAVTLANAGRWLWAVQVTLPDGSLTVLRGALHIQATPPGSAPATEAPLPLTISIDSITVTLIPEVEEPAPEPGAALSPLALAFPPTTVGQSATLTVTIVNSGTADLVLQSAAVTGDFTIIGSTLA